MEQAGFDRLQLIENRTLLLTYEGENVDTINTGGEIITVESDFPMNLRIKEQRGEDGKIVYLYEIDFIDLSIENINKIRRSIYGFLPIFRFNLGEEKILTTPVIFNESEQDNNVSASFSSQMINFVSTNKKLVKFNGNILNWILENGIWEFEKFWINSGLWYF